MSDQITSLYELFALRASQQGVAPAFITPEETITYAEFLSLVDSLSAGLQQEGLKAGERVTTLAKNSIEHFAVLVASTRIGAIVFPANWRLSNTEFTQVVKLTEPAALFIDSEFDSKLTEIDLSDIRIKANLDDRNVSGFTRIKDFKSGAELPGVMIGLDDPAVIIATAAVAGLPRGAVLTHNNLISVGRMFSNAYQLTDKDRFLGVLPLFHIAGLEYLVVMATAGGASVLLPGFDAHLGNQMMDEHQVSLITTFPPMLEQLMAERLKAGTNWDSLRICFGILNPPEVIQKYLDLDRGDYWTGYGQTETTGIATLFNHKLKPGSAGKVVDGLEMQIVDDQDQEVPTGQPGEILVRGNLVFSQYWRDQAASDYAARGGWHHTGDLGRVDEDGFLYYVGRKPEKELIKSGGENIYPVEVENAIHLLPEVVEVCVIGVPDDKWGETVKAVIELAQGKHLNQEDILAGIANHLAAYKKPRLFEFVEKLPRDDSGKVDRLKVKTDFG